MVLSESLSLRFLSFSGHTMPVGESVLFSRFFFLNLHFYYSWDRDTLNIYIYTHILYIVHVIYKDIIIVVWPVTSTAHLRAHVRPYRGIGA